MNNDNLNNIYEEMKKANIKKEKEVNKLGKIYEEMISKRKSVVEEVQPIKNDIKKAVLTKSLLYKLMDEIDAIPTPPAGPPKHNKVLRWKKQVIDDIYFYIRNSKESNLSSDMQLILNDIRDEIVDSNVALVKDYLTKVKDMIEAII